MCITIRKALVALFTVAALTLMACGGRQPLTTAGPDSGPCPAQGGVVDSGSSGTGGSGGNTVIVRVPDAGLTPMLRDSGIINGILDAPRDSVLGMLLCGPEVRLGAPCASNGEVCLLGSLGGLCTCTNGMYICPFDTSRGPDPCPAGAMTGAACASPLSFCVGGAANACLCMFPNYFCL